ncbi:MAG: lipopolysaccharide biosynthesis protein [Rhodospirillales bacterium]
MISRALLRDSGLALVFNVAAVALSTLAAVFLARTMPLAEFGAYVFVQAAAHVVMVVATLGLPLAANRIVPDLTTRGRADAVRGYVVVGLAVVTLVPLAAALAVELAAARWMPAAYVGPTTGFVFVAAVMSAAWQRFVLDALRGAGRPVAATFLDGPLQRGLWVLLVVGLWAGGADIDAATVVLAYAASAVIVTAVGAAMLARRIALPGPVRVGREDLGHWLETARHMMATPVFYLVLSEADALILGLLASPEAVGLYNVARRIAELLKFFYTAANGVSMPRFARSHSEGRPDRLQRAVTAAAVLSLVPSLVLFAIIAAFGHHLLALFGARFVDAYPLLLLVSAIKMADPLLGPVTEVMLMAGLHARTTRVNIVFGAVAILSNLALIPPFGVHGAALATGLTFIGWKTTLYLILRRARGPETCLVVTCGRSRVRAAA